METIELIDVEESEVIGVLRALPHIWRESKIVRFFDTGISPILEKVWQIDDHILSFHNFLRSRIISIMIFTEYNRVERTALFTIHCTKFGLWARDENVNEKRIKKIISEMSREEIREVGRS